MSQLSYWTFGSWIKFGSSSICSGGLSFPNITPQCMNFVRRVRTRTVGEPYVQAAGGQADGQVAEELVAADLQLFINLNLAQWKETLYM
jgi:hypothetical protein